MRNALDDIELSGIRAFADQYRGDDSKLFMTIGEPDFDTPDSIKVAAKEALDDNVTHYPPAMGFVDLRQKIAEYENKFYSSSYNEENVIITNGATESLALALWSVLDLADEIIVPVPSFPLYQTQAKLVGAKTVLLDTSFDSFQISKESLNACVSEKTKALLITSPNNPTGTIYNRDSNQVIYDFLMENEDVYLIIDEVYRAMLFVDDYPSMREYKDIIDRIIVVQSFSKSHAMTGWRVGYVIANETLIDLMHKLHQNMVTGISTISQRAALSALDIQMTEMVKTFKERSQYVSKRLKVMGLEFVEPEGGLYTFFSIKDFGMTSLEFGHRLAKENDLVLVPGVYFGTDGFMRLSYGLEMEKLEEGLNRLEAFIKGL